jgi:hypothetical protein
LRAGRIKKQVIKPVDEEGLSLVKNEEEIEEKE